MNSFTMLHQIARSMGVDFGPSFVGLALSLGAAGDETRGVHVAVGLQNHGMPWVKSCKLQILVPVPSQFFDFSLEIHKNIWNMLVAPIMFSFIVSKFGLPQIVNFGCIQDKACLHGFVQKLGTTNANGLSVSSSWKLSFGAICIFQSQTHTHRMRSPLVSYFWLKDTLNS